MILRIWLVRIEHQGSLTIHVVRCARKPTTKQLAKLFGTIVTAPETIVTLEILGLAEELPTIITKRRR